MKKVKRISLALLVVLLLINSMLVPVFAAQFSDISGHWAQVQINNWISLNLIKGYGDGTFKPNNEMKRAEFISLANRAFGFSKTANIDAYSDVSTDDWYYQDIAKAQEEGYIISDDNTNSIRPEDPITRQEVAVMLGKILKLKEQPTGAYKFTDNVNMGRWDIGYVGAVSALGYISGYPDKTFKPDKSATRAEIVTILNKAVGTLYNQAGDYGPNSGYKNISGNVTISQPDINLNRVTVKGSLYLTEGIGTGSVTLENVTVYGTTIISGGGLNSIRLINCSLGQVVLNSPDSTDIRVSAEGSTGIAGIDVQSSAHIEENNLVGQGYSAVTVNTPAWNPVQFAGSFSKIDVNTPSALVNLVSGSVLELNVTQLAKAAQVYVYPNAAIKTLNLNQAAIVTGTGTIDTAVINVAGSTFAKKPTNVHLGTGISATIAGISTSTTVWVSAVSDQYCSVGSTINIPLYFSPDSATKSVSSNNTLVASTKLTGDSLTITGRSIGTAKITITANYSGYSSTKQAFNVTVSDITGVRYTVARTTNGSTGTGQINKITVPNGARLGAHEVKKIAVGSSAGLAATNSGTVGFTMNDYSNNPAASVSVQVNAGDSAATIASYLINAIKIDPTFLAYYYYYNISSENGNVIVLTSTLKQSDRSLRMRIIDAGNPATGVGNTNSYTGIIGAAPGNGNISFQLNDGTVNQTLTITVADGDSSATVAQKILSAVNSNSAICGAYTASIENGTTLDFTGISIQTVKTVTLTINDNDSTGVGSNSTSTSNTAATAAVQEVNTLSITQAPTRSGVLNCSFSDGTVSVSEPVNVYVGDSVQYVASKIYMAFNGHINGYTVSIPATVSGNGIVYFSNNTAMANKNVVITIK